MTFKISNPKNSWSEFRNFVEQDSVSISFGDAQLEQKLFNVSAIKSTLTEDKVKTLVRNEPNNSSKLSEDDQTKLAASVNDNEKKTDVDLPLLKKDYGIYAMIRDNFIASQMPFCAPRIEENRYDLIVRQDKPLPIKFDKNLLELGSGTASQVRKVQIDERYCDFAKGSGSQKLTNVLAMKIIQSEAHAIRELNFLEATRNIDHKNLTKCYSAFRHAGTYYTINEEASYDLSRLISEKERSNEHNKIWAIQQMLGLASALAKVHCINADSTGYIHDIKPENILVFENDNSTLKLADWSSAKVEVFAGNASHASTPDCNPSFLPPEYRDINDVPRHTSRPHDIFSLGCVFLELVVWLHGGPNAFKKFRKDRDLIDEAFWEGSGTQKRRYPAVNERIDEIEEYLPGLPEVIRNMLEIDPTQRINANDLKDPLERILKRLLIAEQEIKGENSKGEDSKGENSKGEDSKGEDSKGEDSKGEDSKGEDSKGEDSKGERVEGGQAKGG